MNKTGDTHQRKLFGTDGIRGRANRFPMVPEVALQVGRAVGGMICNSGGQGEGRVIIGHDTRLSSDLIVSALISGCCSSGVDVLSAGVVPTPAIAFLVREMGACAGIAVTASHNPYQDNGIKIFNGRGLKLSDAAEQRLESMITGIDPLDRPSGDNDNTPRIGQVRPLPEAPDKYLDFLSGGTVVDNAFKALKIVVDCANGAAFDIAPRLFRRLKVNAAFIGISPNGRNINAQRGSEATEELSRRVLAAGADLGIALDGDGDRLVVVDDLGKRLSGDVLVALLAEHLQRKGKLKPGVVVTTVMSNIGLKIALNRLNIQHVATDVGDRNVTREMVASGAVLGGEDSGHIVFLDRHSAGDGLFTALRLLEVVCDRKAPLSKLKKIMTQHPQVLVNVPVSAKPPLEELPDVAAAVKRAEARLGSNGRILVRYSGTQDLCRVMVEATQEASAQACCATVARAIKAAVG